MVTRDYALQLGQTCLNLARKAETGAERRRLLEMAADWVRLADGRLGSATLAEEVTKR
jgi:hypothetical protein